MANANRRRKLAGLGSQRSAGSNHEARVASASVHFILTQATRKPLDLGKSVQRLLDSEVALTAAWPTEPGVRLAPSIADIDRKTAELLRMRSFADEVGASNSAIGTLLRHPVSFFHMLRMVRSARRAAGQPEINEQPDNLDETMAGLHSLLLDQQKFSMGERQIDALLFESADQRDDEYVRLFLRPTQHELRLGERLWTAVFEPRLLIHRSGAFQITVALDLPEDIGTAEVVAGSYPGNELITESRIPAPYVAEKTQWGGSWDPDSSGLFRDRLISHEQPVSVYDVLRVIEDRVLSAIKVEPEGEWSCYPVVFVGAGPCCPNWAVSHGSDIEGMAARTQPEIGVEMRLPAGHDFAIRATERLHVSAASALRLCLDYWKASADDLHTTMLFEHTMLTFVRLRHLEQRLSRLRTEGREIARNYRLALDLSQLSRGAPVRFETGRDIARDLLQKLGAQRVQENIDRGLSMIGERAATRGAQRTARSGNRLAWLGVAVAVIAALPSIPSIIQLISAQQSAHPHDGFWDLARTLATSPLLLATLILSAAAGYIVANIARVAIRVALFLRGRRKRGYASHVGNFDVVIGATSAEDR